MKNIVAIIGRPNVGKSTLFNRLTGKNTAIVHPESGVTRDRNYGEVDWTGKNFFLIDTGGFVPDSEKDFDKAIRTQIKTAIEESNKIIFVVDSKHGIHPVDKELANLLRKYSGEKKIILAANKIETLEKEAGMSEFFELGLGEAVPVSAISGRGSGDLLDLITEDIPVTEEEEKDTRLKIAVVGKPNAGKSSLINSLLKEERNIVTEIPGTTRDSIDSVIKYFGEEIVLIDTAGLRKKAKVRESLEFYSTVRTYKAIERCDVAILVIDVTEIIDVLKKASDFKLAVFKLDRQDVRIIEDVIKHKKGLLIVINKWDLIEKESNTAKIIEQKIRDHLGSFDFLKFIFISALTRQRIHKVLEEAKAVFEERAKTIKTSELNKVMLDIINSNPPSAAGGKEIKINYITQVKSSPPVFAFFTNHPKLINENYKRFLEKRVRENFGFEGVPLTLVFKEK
jgi:GTP-binding protein